MADLTGIDRASVWRLEQMRAVSRAFVEEVATGGTLSGNALSMAAGRAALVDAPTEEAFDRAATLGKRW